MFKSTRLEDFEQAALSHLKELYNFALKLTGNQSDAEDLTQETYLRAFEKFEQFKPDTKAKSWLFTIMYHLFIDLRKKVEKNYIFVEMEEDRYIDEDSTTYKGLSALSAYVDEDQDLQKSLAEITSEDIKKALEGLPEKYKTLIVLRDFRGFSYREIAEICELAMGTVMSRLSRGRKLLKEIVLHNLPAQK
jgi:RNA polymerase sigma-70 factor (ECF subfamily)